MKCRFGVILNKPCGENPHIFIKGRGDVLPVLFEKQKRRGFRRRFSMKSLKKVVILISIAVLMFIIYLVQKQINSEERDTLSETLLHFPSGEHL